MFKKTAIAALVLGMSSVASAAVIASSCAPGAVSVPCEAQAWDLGVDALYMRTEGGLNSAVADYRADRGWGYRLEGSYHWGTGNDVNLNWAHFKKTTAAGTTPISAAVQDKFDVVNVEFGQMINVSEAVSMRFHGGVQFLEISSDNRTAAIVAAGTGVNSAKGWGPRFGLDTTYAFGNGFAVFGNGAFTVQKVKATVAGVSGTHSTDTGHDTKLGVSYTHAMAQGDLSARLAWENTRYSGGTNNGDYGWTGMSVGLKWVGQA
jgi:hypothetical protein